MDTSIRPAPSEPDERAVRQVYALTAAWLQYDADALARLLVDAADFSAWIVPVSALVASIEVDIIAGHGRTSVLDGLQTLVADSPLPSDRVLSAVGLLRDGDLAGCDRTLRGVVQDHGMLSAIIGGLEVVAAALSWQSEIAGDEPARIVQRRCLQTSLPA